MEITFLLLFSLMFGSFATKIDDNGCREPGRYGENCDQECHCEGRMQCNISTGQCSNGQCAPGWQGPSCEQDPRYLGCYTINSLAEKSWMDFASFIWGAPLRVDKCVAECAKQQYHLSGLRNGNECWCSNGTTQKLTTCDGCCQRPCTGDHSSTCGGPNAADIYEAVLDRRYIGCYQDRPNRLIADNSTGRTMKIDDCVKHCGMQNYTTAAMKYGHQCICDHGHGSYNLSGRCDANACHCSYPCQGNLTEKCGGESAKSIYIAECRDIGRYGEKCDQECHCEGGMQCNISTGQCPNGQCAPGWQGPSCEQECDNGTFGVNCSKECHCFDSIPCHKIEGTCPNGRCDTDYKDSDKTCQTMNRVTVELTRVTFGVICFVALLLPIIGAAFASAMKSRRKTESEVQEGELGERAMSKSSLEGSEEETRYVDDNPYAKVNEYESLRKKPSWI